MATQTKDNQKCEKCGREPVRVYYDKRTGKWLCGKCGRKH